MWQLCFLLCLCQFYEADERHKKTEAELRERLEKLEKDAEQHQGVMDGLTTKYAETIERLQSDKARLEVRAQREKHWSCSHNCQFW